MSVVVNPIANLLLLSGSGGGGTPDGNLYVSQSGAGLGDGSSQANAMSASDFLAYTVPAGIEVRILEDLEV